MMTRFKSVDPDNPMATLRERVQRSAAHCAQADNRNVIVAHQRVARVFKIIA
jgi:hypothetical protein